MTDRTWGDVVPGLPLQGEPISFEGTYEFFGRMEGDRIKVGDEILVQLPPKDHMSPSFVDVYPYVIVELTASGFRAMPKKVEKPVLPRGEHAFCSPFKPCSTSCTMGLD